MEMKWKRKKRRARRPSEGCSNCTTDRYPIRARRLCTRCYPLTLRIEKLERGDLVPLGSLRGLRDAQIEAMRRSYIRQYRTRLGSLQIREQQRRDGVHVDALTIEHLLQRLGRRAGARGDPHQGVASLINHNFPGEARLALFRLLHDIEERIPWQPKVADAVKEYLEQGESRR